jgi:hypothetical protein
MIQARKRASLPVKPRFSLFVFEERLRKNLDRDGPPEAKVLRLPDLPHPARAEPGDDLERAETHPRLNRQSADKSRPAVISDSGRSGRGHLGEGEPVPGRQPPRHAAAVGSVLAAESFPERRLLVEDDEEMEAGEDREPVDDELARAENERFAEDDVQDGQRGGAPRVRRTR